MDDKQLSNSKKKKRYGFLFRFLIRIVADFCISSVSYDWKYDVPFCQGW